jgi:hypothetical protein
MKELTIREFQLQAGTLTHSDCPIIIMRYKKPLFVLESFETMDKLYELADYNAQYLYEDNQKFRHFIKEQGFNPDLVLEGYDEQVPGKPVKVSNKQEELLAKLKEQNPNFDFSKLERKV